MTEVKITKHGKAVIKKIVAEMTDVFISCVISNNHLDKKFVAHELLKIMNKEDIYFMRDTHPAIDKVFTNISKVCELETQNGWTYKLKK